MQISFRKMCNTPDGLYLPPDEQSLAERGSVVAAVPALEVGRHGSQSSLGSSTVLSASSGGSLTDVRKPGCCRVHPTVIPCVHVHVHVH